ncbi:MAG: hypothetical protein Q9201_005622 [Fulgogasparrea decipioides]
MESPPKPETSNEPSGVTSQLCQWIEALTLKDIPVEIQERAKYLILDGLACGLNGAHVPWSEQAVKVMVEFEGPGDHPLFGWDVNVGPLNAALLNGAFIQACELDDFHSAAPLHSCAVILPALFAAAQSRKRCTNCRSENAHFAVNGATFLLACIVGFEVGPRAGHALNGTEILQRGWHCGTIFGHPAAAAATSKLLGAPSGQIESAIGIACTQACGLMSAQYEGMIKRMQHGFAARNGLFAARLASSGYVGIHKVFERPYGGFLATFSQGSARDPQYQESEVVKDLGRHWHTREIRTKMHACVGGAHGLVEAIALLQHKEPEKMGDLRRIAHIKIRLSHPMFVHGGWKAERPITATGAQMNAGYICAVQLVDKQVLLGQFADSKLDRDEVWDLVPKIDCEHGPEFDHVVRGCGTHVVIKFGDGSSLEEVIDQPRGFDPPLSNEELLGKWRKLTENLVDHERRDAIEKYVLELDQVDDVGKLSAALSGSVANPLE